MRVHAHAHLVGGQTLWPSAASSKPATAAWPHGGALAPTQHTSGTTRLHTDTSFLVLSERTPRSDHQAQQHNSYPRVLQRWKSEQREGASHRAKQTEKSWKRASVLQPWPDYFTRQNKTKAKLSWEPKLCSRNVIQCSPTSVSPEGYSPRFARGL